MDLTHLISNKQRKDSVALIFQDSAMTYQDLNTRTDWVAQNLIEAGIRHGDRVALFMFNSVEMVILYFAIFKLGAVAVPVNNRFKAAELAYVLTHCQVKLLVIDEIFLPLYHEVQYETNVKLILSGSLSNNPNKSTVTSTHLINPHDLACILYTSGTTSKPKGVMHTHTSLLNTAINQTHSLQINQHDKALITLSICHIAGFAGQLLTTLYAGGQVILSKQFDLDIMLGLMEKNPITYLMLLPAQLAALIDHPKTNAKHFISLRRCVAGGDKVPVETQKRFHTLSGKYVTECCGMTESFSYAINLSNQSNYRGSIGTPAYATELKIVDDNNQTLSVNQTGEIIVKSLANMIGYWNNPEATRDVIKDMWIYTGDLAYQDETGYYWFAGRKKDIIIRGGSNISPLEVEDVIYQHPAIKETGVFGYPDKVLGQVVIAAVVLKEKQTLTAENLKKFISTYIADYKIPEKIIFATELPHNAIGKLDRKALKNIF